ncbi:NTP transferase domain-containing protein [Liquorilactobacillus nagelii]|uniref:NTP transferase domain-containing protein n=1 Tax=Liquorilactobacillus nagelii TaxID=82688 RepID=UPI0039ECE2C2
MNNLSKEVFLKILNFDGNLTQRKLSELTNLSLGKINSIVRILKSKNFITSKLIVTKQGYDYLSESKVHGAIILAAGFGMRMVPINTEIPKGLIEVRGERLIERLIKQLHAVNIFDITIVVGFMKEKYEYLIDKFHVKLVVNDEYAEKNNLYSLALVADELRNCYIVPCDLWFKENPFRKFELYSWYLVSNQKTYTSSVEIKNNLELKQVGSKKLGNTMIGLTYCDNLTGSNLASRLRSLIKDPAKNQYFWEIAFFQNGRCLFSGRKMDSKSVIEIDTFEQLRDLDANSNNLNNDAINTITHELKVKQRDIHEIKVLKKGMTNRSFLFKCEGKKYIMRIPGEGTDKLVNRRKETEVYQKIQKYHISDNIVYINAFNGYKITEFLTGARNCNPQNFIEVKQCMDKLRELHSLKIKVDHEFNLFKQIDFYEQLRVGFPSVYPDYEETKKNVWKLKEYIEKQSIEKSLTHIDAVPDNFLFVPQSNGTEQIRLIDWEYASMQDPHVDIAMFAIYSMYSKDNVDKLIDNYFEGKCSKMIRIKIYCYIAICGLLWSNWCEYKFQLGVDFGEYSLCQYHYAKEYYQIVTGELGLDE